MSEEEKINLNIKFEENLPINKKRKRSLSHQNTQIKIKPSKKIKIDKQQEAKFENNILPISLEKNDKVYNLIRNSQSLLFFNKIFLLSLFIIFSNLYLK